jgi:hypothetical protein
MVEFEGLRSAHGTVFVARPRRDGRDDPADVVVESGDRMRTEDGDFGRIKSVICSVSRRILVTPSGRPR